MAATRKVQFLAPLLQREAEQTVRSCNGNLKKEACLTHSKVVSMATWIPPARLSP